jgi:hypothetical protein
MNSSVVGKLRLLGAFELFAALGALFGGGALVLAPDGSLMGMPLSMLAGSPFATFFVPGLLLLVVVGGCNTAAAILAFLSHPRAAIAGGVAGMSLMVWIAVQVQLLGYVHPLQPIMFTIGLIVLALGALVFGADPRSGKRPGGGEAHAAA